MRGSAKVVDRDLGWGALKKTLQSLKGGGSYAKVGMLGEKAATVEHEREPGAEPLTNVSLMAIHEFGTEHVPERSVIRRVFDEKREEYVALIRKLVPAVYEGKTSARKVLEIVGMKMKSDMKDLILRGDVTPPLAPSTIKAKERKGRWNKSPSKGAPTPLMDTGRLAAAIDHAVVIQDREQASISGTETEAGSATLVSEP
jgi:hypothetical protein